MQPGGLSIASLIHQFITGLDEWRCTYGVINDFLGVASFGEELRDIGFLLVLLSNGYRYRPPHIAITGNIDVKLFCVLQIC